MLIIENLVGVDVKFKSQRFTIDSADSEFGEQRTPCSGESVAET